MTHMATSMSLSVKCRSYNPVFLRKDTKLRGGMVDLFIVHKVFFCLHYDLTDRPSLPNCMVSQHFHLQMVLSELHFNQPLLKPLFI